MPPSVVDTGVVMEPVVGKCDDLILRSPNPVANASGWGIGPFLAAAAAVPAWLSLAVGGKAPNESGSLPIDDDDDVGIAVCGGVSKEISETPSNWDDPCCWCCWGDC